MRLMMNVADSKWQTDTDRPTGRQVQFLRERELGDRLDTWQFSQNGSGREIIFLKYSSTFGEIVSRYKTDPMGEGELEKNCHPFQKNNHVIDQPSDLT